MPFAINNDKGVSHYAVFFSITILIIVVIVIFILVYLIALLIILKNIDE